MNKQTPFHKILIANRGEIALRVIRTARAMGYRTVAVYSTADADSRHVREADQAVWIGEALPAESYLRVDEIIKAAKLSGADAIHPGYGFLAENAALPKACQDAGIVFIGPSADAIVAMGHKAEAKRLMENAGVPCVPGYQGKDQSEGRLSEEAERIGFPVMIKATAGGGGRGMRLVENAKDFADALRSAKSEAQSAFGDPEVILERAIIEPRHIEIQIMADRYGNAIHFGERDCSIQRRHQKVVEEAPSPAVNDELRQKMGETAVAAVKAIGYEGAGTLEFLLDKDGNYYFMEMNTRLQVEHPVTEAITGLDLVELQLRVAAGEGLPIGQEEITYNGHAIEVRLCAESPRQSFMPQSGCMQLWQMPDSIRVEDALESGAEIPPFYDSMIAKLISYGRSREEARRKLISALQDTVALGVETNQEFLVRCLEHPVFIDGGATTAFVNDHGEALLEPDAETEARALALAAAMLYAAAPNNGKSSISQIAHRLPVNYHFEINGEEQKVDVLKQDDGMFAITADKQTCSLQIVSAKDSIVSFICDGLTEKAVFLRQDSLLLFQYRGHAYRVQDLTYAAASLGGEGGSDGKVRSSMNGRVVAIHVAVGDKVEAGQPLLVLEAMKMEHVHTAPVAGEIVDIHVTEGEQVAAARIVVEIEPEQQ